MRLPCLPGTRCTALLPPSWLLSYALFVLEYGTRIDTYGDRLAKHEKVQGTSFLSSPATDVKAEHGSVDTTVHLIFGNNWYYRVAPR